MTTKPYRPWAPHQPYLLPPSPADWLPKNHLAYFLLDLVAELDLSAIEAVIQARDPRGVRPYPPQMMVALLLYAYSRGVYSSRRIARATHEDVAMRVIAGEHHPHFTTIASFRQDHLEALGELFVQVLKMCRAAGLAKLGHVSLDGTKVQANASKHSAMSYERMQAEEKRLADEVTALLAIARDKDEEEDEHLGKGEDDMDVPAELARREARLDVIRAARAALEREAAVVRAAELRALADVNDERAAEDGDPSAAKGAATRAGNQRKKADELDPPKDDSEGGPPGDAGPSGPSLPLHAPAHNADGEPDPKAQRNFTDPDSRIMKQGSDYVQAYNAQAAVDAESHVIVSHALSNQAPDAEYFPAVVQGVADNLGCLPEKVSADAGYWSAENAAWSEEHGIDAHIAVRRQRHREQGPDVLTRGGEAVMSPDSTSEPGASPENAVPDNDLPVVETASEAGAREKILDRCSARPPMSPRDKMRAKLDSPEGREVYRLRKCTPEPVFGNIKEARGFRRFLLRGMHKVRQEWALICTAHNLLKLHGARLAM